MRLYPTGTAAHLAIAGAAVVGVGLVAGQPAVVGWGAALVFGVAIARAGTLVSVARIRAAGFEMLWSSGQRVARLSRGGEVTIEAEVRNRDTLAARYVGLRAIASSQIDVTLDPAEGEVPAGGRLKVSVKVHAPRVGRHGVFGLALEVRGAPGLFEVPLTFANPYGVEVLPAGYTTHLRSARGGRTRLAAEGGQSGNAAGEGSDLREVREHRPGDPFKRIAWRASARRGKLMVREMEHEERDVVWVVLDASVELWAGVPGTAPLDMLIDDAASIVDRHVRHGDRVGLIVVGSRALVEIPPDRGVRHAVALHEALAFATGTYDRDRSEADEADVALRVLEHLRPLDPHGLADVSRRDLDKLAQRAATAMSRAPFRPEPPDGASARERKLRQYLAAFGVESPPRAEPDHPRTAAAMVGALERIRRERRPRASVVYVAGVAPGTEELGSAVKKLVQRGVAVRWLLPRFLPSVEALRTGRAETSVLLRAMETRMRVGAERAARVVRRLGARLERSHEGHPPRHAPGTETDRT